MNALANRLHRLERATAALDTQEPCPHCGHTPGVQPTHWQVVFGGDPDADQHPERCPHCGERLLYHLEFDQLG